MANRRQRTLIGRGAAVIALLTVIAAVGVGVLALGDDAGSDSADDVPRYSAPFKVLASQGQPVREATTLRIVLPVGTCGLGDVSRLNAPLQVDVQDRREAVVIRARLDLEYAEKIDPQGGNPCPGIMQSVQREVRLPRPIGARALLNGGFDQDQGLPRVVLRSSVREYQRALRSRAQRLRYVGLDDEGTPAAE
jgi:hypothetical protein